MNRPTPTDIIAAHIPSADDTQWMFAKSIIEALEVAGHRIVSDSTPRCPETRPESLLSDVDTENGIGSHTNPETTQSHTEPWPPPASEDDRHLGPESINPNADTHPRSRHDRS